LEDERVVLFSEVTLLTVAVNEIGPYCEGVGGRSEVLFLIALGDEEPRLRTKLVDSIR
jgi:hypothetical protein